MSAPTGRAGAVSGDSLEAEPEVPSVSRGEDAAVSSASERPRWARIGSAIINLGTGELHRAGSRMHLTRTELRLLQVLVEFRGSPVRRERLLVLLWGRDTGAEGNRTVDVNIGRLRKKLETDPAHPQLILTVAGYGYLLQSERPPA